MKVQKPKLTLVTADNIHSMKANLHSKHGVAKGDRDYEEMKEAFRQLIVKGLKIDPDNIR